MKFYIKDSFNILEQQGVVVGVGQRLPVQVLDTLSIQKGTYLVRGLELPDRAEGERQRSCVFNGTGAAFCQYIF